ncbi:AMP-binding protein [Carboxylicivirga caseinilyticus]|uniref:AMP-binding protein n=1 Tax=Carboxylicivirga caseinilyticus TaxID=3417572 RepID=UPI003D34962B|nr:AMP-binding protein [Marinilabiliaceae bacterium A049]
MKEELLHKKYLTLNFNHQLYEDEEGLSKLIYLLKKEADRNDWKLALSSFLEEWMNESVHIELFTSGSTGSPKKIIMSKASMIYSAQRTLEFFHLKEGDKALLCLSVNYIAGKMMVVRALIGGLHLITSGVQSNPFVDLEEEIDFAAFVPTQALCAFERSKEKFQLVKTMILGGAKVDKNLADKMCQVSSKVWETYGMTETVSHIALKRVKNDVNEPFTVLNNIQISTDNRSCLVIEPSDINPELIVTNDIVELIGANQFILRGRFDNVINSGGIKIFPEELEAKLSVFININFVIIGLPDEKWGESVVLVLESKESIAIENSMLDSINSYEKPKRIYCLDTFPRTESGKVKRGEIKEKIVNNINSNIA